MGDFRRDLRDGWRSLMRAPVVTLVVVLSLALGAGMNTAICSLVYVTLLRPIPLPTLDRLFVLSKQRAGHVSEFSTSEAHLVRESTRDIAAIGAVAWRGGGWAQFDGGKDRVSLRFADPEFSHVLGVKPVVGRWFTQEEQRTAAGVAVLNDWSWRVRFRQSSLVLGRSLIINGVPVTIIGVLPATFTLEAGIEESDVITLPLSTFGQFAVAAASGRAESAAEPPSLSLVARLTGAAAPSTLAVRLATVADHLTQSEPDVSRTTVSITAVPGRIAAVPAWARSTIFRLLLLLGIVAGLILLLGCTSLGAMLLARAEDRRGEMQIRAALGASRARLIRQVLTEALVLAFLAASAAVVVAVGFPRLFGNYALADTLRISSLFPVPRAWIVLCAGTLSIVVTALSVTVPALWLSNSQFVGIGHKAVWSGIRSSRAQMSLLAAQVAISLVLLIGTGLLARSLHRGLTVDLGYADAQLVEIAYSLDVGRWTPEKHYQFRRRLVERVRHVPGVVSSGIGESPLITFDVERAVTIDGRAAAEDGRTVRIVHVDHDYREAVGLRLVAGRDLATADDRTWSRPVALVNEAFAQRFFGQRNAVGHTFRRSSVADGPEFLVVGVVANSRFTTLRSDNQATAYVPRDGNPSYPTGGWLVVRTAGAADAVIPHVTRIFGELAPDEFPPDVVWTVAQHRASLFTGQRVGVTLLGCFGALGLSLAVIGVAGSVLYTIQRRRSEFGVRMALGATPHALIRHSVALGMRPVVVGIGAGFLTACYLAKLLRPFLFDVSPRDPLGLAGAVLAMALAGILASWLPARRVARIDPAEALRAE